MNLLKKELELNKMDRIWFIKKWVDYMKTHSDKEWSRQQNLLINSIMQNARYFKISPKRYLEIRGEICNRAD